MPTVTLAKGSIMYWGGKSDSVLSKITEHNRSPLSVSWEQIENSKRMIDGTLRRWTVARKRTWATSWDMVPHSNIRTVDGGWGGEQMQAFYLSHGGEFSIEISNPDGTKERVLAMFSSFDKSIEKRGAYEMWNVSVSIEEV